MIEFVPSVHRQKESLHHWLIDNEQRIHHYHCRRATLFRLLLIRMENYGRFLLFFQSSYFPFFFLIFFTFSFICDPIWIVSRLSISRHSPTRRLPPNLILGQFSVARSKILISSGPRQLDKLLSMYRPAAESVAF